MGEAQEAEQIRTHALRQEFCFRRSSSTAEATAKGQGAALQTSSTARCRRASEYLRHRVQIPDLRGRWEARTRQGEQAHQRMTGAPLIAIPCGRGLGLQYEQDSGHIQALADPPAILSLQILRFRVNHSLWRGQQTIGFYPSSTQNLCSQIHIRYRPIKRPMICFRLSITWTSLPTQATTRRLAGWEPLWCRVTRTAVSMTTQRPLASRPQLFLKSNKIGTWLSF